MKIYIAAHDRGLGLEAGATLSQQGGHQIASRWLFKEFNPTEKHTVDERIAIAGEDVEDVTAADVLVLLAGPDRYPGGKFVETGYALALGRRVIVVGRRENMLLWHPRVEQVESLAEAVSLLADPAPHAVTSGEGPCWWERQG